MSKENKKITYCCKGIDCMKLSGIAMLQCMLTMATPDVENLVVCLFAVWL